MDMFSRMIVGWAAGPTIHREKERIKGQTYKNRELVLADAVDPIDTLRAGTAIWAA